MAVYALDDVEPEVHPSAYVDKHAVVVGAVRIGEDSSIRPCAVLRGDFGAIAVGDRTSIQDGAVLHTTPERPTVIGSDCIVGHLAHVEGATVQDGAVVGSGAVVLAGCLSVPGPSSRPAPWCSRGRRCRPGRSSRVCPPSCARVPRTARPSREARACTSPTAAARARPRWLD